MSMQARVSTLKKQFEQLFPGKWLTGVEKSRNLMTGLSLIDQSVSKGIVRRKITEWIGPVSSGKTSLLRAAITNWCAQGLNVAYIDVDGRLLAADWAYVDQGGGKFWIVRPPDKDTVIAPTQDESNVVPLVSKRSLYFQEAVWSADQLIRSRAFDAVILDLGSTDPSDRRKQGMSYNPVPSKVYARLQRSLDRSNAALIVVRDGNVSNVESGAWGCHVLFNFDWGTAIKCEPGLAGLAMITPSVRFSISKDGISQGMEVDLGCSVQNRLFAHPQVPDRRTSKG